MICNSSNASSTLMQPSLGFWRCSSESSNILGVRFEFEEVEDVNVSFFDWTCTSMEFELWLRSP